MTDDEVRTNQGWCELCMEMGDVNGAVGRFATDLGIFWLCEEHRSLAEKDEQYVEVFKED